MGFHGNFARTIFGEAVWNNSKRHVLEFGSNWLTILSKGAKLFKIGSTDIEGFLNSHSGSKENTLPAPSLHKVLNRVFQDHKGRWKQEETSLGMKPTWGVVMVMWVPQKWGLSHPFKPGSYFLAPYEEYTCDNSYRILLRSGSSQTTNRQLKRLT